ncbi:MAG: shikimate kinase [Lysobacterales bacterium CG17_big_fil_post_rev_8_21_14_2_50_64_11]|nr:MAG: shikimate kinase [Xanthomonadales bacterium CG17_big_fil_post_rev_8_21_14_2_50_64_11]PIX60084.1 MAG: shikimate kinase [Xanthomonadales bacterium CG_4_10_14_3_um_filter_64_11]
MQRAANILFIGPMGAGKTVIARRVATHFGLRFVDTDALIEQRTGTSIPIIFDVEGEGGFRAREKTVIGEVCALHGQVIATGGGAVLDSENQHAIKQAGVVVYLRVSLAEQFKRVANDHNRPLLATSDPAERLRLLAQQREPIYQALADLRFSTDAMNAETTSKRVIARLASMPRLQHLIERPGDCA